MYIRFHPSWSEQKLSVALPKRPINQIKTSSVYQTTDSKSLPSWHILWMHEFQSEVISRVLSFWLWPARIENWKNPSVASACLDSDAYWFDLRFSRGVAGGGPGGQSLPPEYDGSVNPIQTKGEQIMPLKLLPAPPDSKSYLHLWSCDIEKILPRMRILLSSDIISSLENTVLLTF